MGGLCMAILCGNVQDPRDDHDKQIRIAGGVDIVARVGFQLSGAGVAFFLGQTILNAIDAFPYAAFLCEAMGLGLSAVETAYSAYVYSFLVAMNEKDYARWTHYLAMQDSVDSELERRI